MENQHSITLESFWKTSIFFFAQERPRTEEEYLEGYGLASHAWLAFKNQIDQYSLSNHQKQDLQKLFELADDYFFYVNSEEYTYHSPFLQQKWYEMNQLANHLIRTKP